MEASSRIHGFNWLVGEVRVLFERRVDVVDVGLVMLRPVDVHRLSIDIRLQRVLGIGKIGQRVSHDSLLPPASVVLHPGGRASGNSTFYSGEPRARPFSPSS